MSGSESKRTESAGGVVINKMGQVLVVSQLGNSWSLPKGHIDAGEEPVAAAKREICEETGIRQLEFIKALGNYGRYRIGLTKKEDTSEFKTIHMFLFRTNEERLAPQDPKHPEAKWIDKDEVADLLTHEKDKEFFRKNLGQIEELCG